MVGAEQPADHEVALTRSRQVLVDDDPDLQAVADQFLLVGRQPLDDLAQALQRRSAAQLGDHCAVGAGDDVRIADRPAALRHDRDTVHAGQAHADRAGGQYVAVAEQPSVARSQPAAHHAAQHGRSGQIRVEVLDEHVRRECVRIRQQQMQIVRGPVEPIPGEQATRPVRMKSSWNVSAARPDASHTATAASSSNSWRPATIAWATQPISAGGSTVSCTALRTSAACSVCDRDPSSTASDGASPASSSRAYAAASTAAFRASGAVEMPTPIRTLP